MSDFGRHLEASLEDPEFRREWEAQSAEREVMARIVEARMAEGVIQDELAEVPPAGKARTE